MRPVSPLELPLLDPPPEDAPELPDEDVDVDDPLEVDPPPLDASPVDAGRLRALVFATAGSESRARTRVYPRPSTTRPVPLGCGSTLPPPTGTRSKPPFP